MGDICFGEGELRSKVVYGFGSGIFQPFVLFEAQIARCAEVQHFIVVYADVAAVKGLVIGIEVNYPVVFSV